MFNGYWRVQLIVTLFKVRRKVDAVGYGRQRLLERENTCLWLGPDYRARDDKQYGQQRRALLADNCEDPSGPPLCQLLLY
jgi:hypothetical protein